LRAFIATMQQPFDDSFKEIADSMGISLYQRFSVAEASLFLRCHTKELNQIIKQNKIDYIQLTATKIEIFGYQLLQYLLNQTTHNKIQTPSNSKQVDRILRANEVHTITGLSRTTLWRMENKEEFPRRVSLGANSVGWRLSEIENWMKERQ